MKERKLTLAQCLVGGYFGFGLFVGILCYGVGAGLLFWLVMTTFLTARLYHLLFPHNQTAASAFHRLQRVTPEAVVIEQALGVGRAPGAGGVGGYGRALLRPGV